MYWKFYLGDAVVCIHIWICAAASQHQLHLQCKAQTRHLSFVLLYLLLVHTILLRSAALLSLVYTKQNSHGLLFYCNRKILWSGWHTDDLTKDPAVIFQLKNWQQQYTCSCSLLNQTITDFSFEGVTSYLLLQYSFLLWRLLVTKYILNTYARNVPRKTLNHLHLWIFLS